MDAEQYLERIENKGLDGSVLYSRAELISFAEKYAGYRVTSSSDEVGVRIEKNRVDRKRY